MPLLLVACGDDGPEPLSDRALIETSKGSFVVSLFETAPLAVENFTGLAERGYYEGVIFHRVVSGFMIQGGDPTGTGTGGTSFWGTPFQDEIDPDQGFDHPGLLAMANSGPNTNTSQFFITVVPTPHLNGKHTIFGEVVSGMDVVLAISEVPTGENGKPLEPVFIGRIRIER